ncbi:stage II sporulation protein M [Methanolinea mesophila]|uniref:stage II sporulation protein M n=1 Tax=Methanolinea mesophila TaxID=547055 RepID=UPI001AE2B47A|nr:stage II sporulation protein M [Methanolinea mesophila]MBP1928238.1 stage II sporulation protein M [Methanolinea mesophila]
MSEPAIWKNLGFTAFLFALCLSGGILIAAANPEVGQQFLDLFREAIMGELMTDEPLLLAGNLFLNNLQACVLLFLGGATFGLFTLFVIGTNGLVIGAILQLVTGEKGLLYVAAAIVPHGIFEIPAFIIAGALGFTLAGGMWKELTGGGDAVATAQAVGKHFLTIVIPLVAVAALVEAFITPYILQFVA